MSTSTTTTDLTPAQAGPRVLVVTAGIGSGHTAVADELVRRLTSRGAICTQFDMVGAAGRAGARLVATYRTLLTRAPVVYDAAMRTWARVPGPFEWLTGSRAAPFELALLTAVRESSPDLIVSTYNLASQCLGRLRRRGDVDCRVVTVVTDPGAHPYWVAPGVDLVCAPTGDTAAGLADHGAGSVTVAAPLLPPHFRGGVSRAEARERVGLPTSTRLAVVNGGSWGAGALRGTVDLLRRVPGVTPVVLCGRDGDMLAELSTRPDVHALGWRTDMPDLLAAADVVVDNAGGQTCWEALACGRPVVMYRPLAGHGRFNADALERSGLVRRARRASQLIECVLRPVFPTWRVQALFAAGDAADAVLARSGAFR